MRVYMCKGAMRTDTGIDIPHGAGGLYIVPDELGQHWVDGQLAYEDGHPPSCSECGEVFEGLKAYSAFAMHMRFSVPACSIRKLPVGELRERAKGLGIKGAGKLRKAELVEAIARMEG
jgi:hypothetical protein